MSKSKETIQERINKLEAIQYLITQSELRVQYFENDAKEYLEQCTDENGNIDESNWRYEYYEELKQKVNAYNKVIEELEDLA